MAKVVAKVWKDETTGRYTTESLDSLVKRFKKKVANEGIIKSIRDKEFYVSRTIKKKLAKEESTKRIKRDLAKQAEREKAYASGKRIFKKKKKKDNRSASKAQINA